MNCRSRKKRKPLPNIHGGQQASQHLLLRALYMTVLRTFFSILHVANIVLEQCGTSAQTSTSTTALLAYSWIPFCSSALSCVNWTRTFFHEDAEACSDTFAYSVRSCSRLPFTSNTQHLNMIVHFCVFSSTDVSGRRWNRL